MSLPFFRLGDASEPVVPTWPAPTDWAALSLQWPVVGWLDGLRWTWTWWSALWPTWEAGSATTPFVWTMGVAPGSSAATPVAAPARAKQAVAPTAATAEVLTLPRAPRATASRAAAAVADDLTRLEGVGPKIALALAAAGIRTFAQLASTSVDHLQALLAEAGPRFKLARADTWPEQAALLAAGNEAAFTALTDALRGGRRV